MKKNILVLLLFLLAFNYSSGQVIINEVSPDNEESMESLDGDYYDWIELYNRSDQEIDLSSLYLSDNEDELDMWKFPDISILPNEFLIVFCSDRDELYHNELHTNFRLSSGGETVFLTDGTNIIDSMSFGKVNEDYSYGRLDEESEIKVNLTYPTPGKSNSLSGTIIADRESGYYLSEFNLELTAANGAEIYYTTNGDVPTEDSELYSESLRIADEYEEYEYLNIPTTPLDSFNCKIPWTKLEENIPRCKTISYRAKNIDGSWGRTHNKTFFFQSIHEIPVVSIVTNNAGLFSQDTGIYVPGLAFDINAPCWSGNYFIKSSERFSSVSYFENERLKFEENAGIKIHGGGTRSLPQKSIKFYARKEYGVNKFKNHFFPDLDVKEFNSLLLRTPMADWNNTLFKDGLTMELVKDFNFERTYVKPVIVYINGNYWGISDLRNRINDNYLEEKYDIDNNTINIIKVDNPDYPKHGSFDDFEPVYKFIKDNDLSIAANYKIVSDKIAIVELIDYYIAEMYFSNFDWPGNNFTLWNSSEYDGKYRPIFFDLDGGWYDAKYNMFEHISQMDHEDWPNPKRVNVIFMKLLENEGFKSLFIERNIHHLENNFLSDEINSKIAEYTSIYSKEIENMNKRFNFPESKEIWLQDIEKYLIDFNEKRECEYRKNLVNYFDLDSNILCSVTSVDYTNNYSNELYPNPAEDFIKIVTKEHSGEVAIFDINGLKIKTIQNYNSEEKIHIKNLIPGIYFVKSNDKLYKFIKIKQ